MTVRYPALEIATRPEVSAAAFIRLPAVLVTLGLMLTDALVLAGTFFLTYWLRFRTHLPLFEWLPMRDEFYLQLSMWVVPVWLALFLVHGAYDRRFLFSGFREYLKIANACTTGTIIVILMSFLDIHLVISRGWLLMVWALSIVSVGLSRFVIRRGVWHWRSKGHLLARTVIVGGNEEGRALAEHLQADPRSGLEVIGFVDGSAPRGTSLIGDLQVLGDLEELKENIDRWKVNEIVVAPTALTRDELIELYWAFGHDSRVQLRLSSGLFEILTTGVVVHEASGVPLMTPRRVRITGIDAILKATLDYVGACVALALLSPLLLLISALLRLDSAERIIYRRRVLGRSGRPFHAFKFRTMTADRRQRREQIFFPDRRSRDKSPTDPRITRLGLFLRRSSLDELPQLINVLRGEMSLIGPRMISPEESHLYGKWQLNLLTVKPGITGPWQVHGRGSIPYDERVRLSMNYIRNYSIWLDLEILLRTIPVVLQGKGAY